jgi:probable F420-dependent oxidoreductase
VQIGAVFPQTELASDHRTTRLFAEGVEKLGFRHIIAFDHVVGADPAIHSGWERSYDIDTTFHEPLVLYGFLAGLTRLELVTSVIIAPQRQTVLLAKQAAEVDILAEGRFRLGIGVGWNEVEYEALGQNFRTRGQRQEEQIALLRRLWTERSVSHDGRFDRVTGAGIAPAPRQRPIPIWLGGSSPQAYGRIGRMADGWFPAVSVGPELEAALEMISAAASKAGRDPSKLGMEPQLSLKAVGAGRLVEHVEAWLQAGASHLAINSMGHGLQGVADHLDAFAAVAEALHLESPSSTSR